MGKLYHRYKKNNRQVGGFVKANYTEVEEETTQDLNELEVSKNPLQLESVEKRNGGEPPTSTDNKHDVKQSDNDELNQELYDLPKEFRQHLKEYISTQNNNSQNIKDESKTKETVVNTKKIKESYEVEAEQLGFQNLPKNLAHSLISWKKAGRPVVESHQWDNRINICRSCSYWTENSQTNYAKCTKCGCGSGKLLLASSSCPLTPPKW